MPKLKTEIKVGAELRLVSFLLCLAAAKGEVAAWFR